MTGTRWLERYVGRHGKGLHVRVAMKRRVRDHVRRLSPKEARDVLRGLAGQDGAGSKDWQTALLGGWSQAMDHYVRIILGQRARQPVRAP